MISNPSERARQIAALASHYEPTVREEFVRNAAAGDPDVEGRALAILRQSDISDTQPLSFGSGTSGLAPGTLLKERYLIIREMNRGGFGVVYLAHDQQLHGKPVVVKLQLDTLGDDPWFERKFAEEIRALALIDHPGVVGALDCGKTAEGRPFLVMQYVQGRSLRTVINPEGMPFDRVASIVRQTGQALAAAHDKRIWHRDLKPENIMLQALAGGEEYVRLIDFGIATIADLQSTQRRVATRVAGSLGYMAPEQITGQPSSATDVYALGVIAYEMVTGRKPFVSEDAVQLSALQRAGARIKPCDLRPGLSPRAQKLILQALSYNPKDRPASALEFGEQLATALLAGPNDPTTGTHALAVRKRYVVTALLAGVGVVALGTGAWLLLPGSHREAAPLVKSSPSVTKPAVTAEPIQQDNVALELEFWNSIKNENRPELYREYLAKYPHGQFATVARIKLDNLTRTPSPATAANAAPVKNKPTEPAVVTVSLPPLRPALNADEYSGPLRGGLQWSGHLAANDTVTIQAGRVNKGSLSGDLPRVPVTVEAPGVSIVEAPSEQNNWDRLVLRNDAGKSLDAVNVRWKLGK